MAKKGRIIGIKTVTKNLEKQMIRMNVGGTEGLRAAAAYIRYDMDKTRPLIPIDTGKLRASWFQRSVKTKMGPGIIFGLSANYAMYVHERQEGAPWGEGTVGIINWSRPGSGPKFFEASLKRNKERVMQILQKHMR